MYKIVIFMFLLNPSNDLDALEVNYKNSKLLEFSKIEECYNHIYNNLQELKDFSKIHYGPNSVVKSIDCFKKGS
tara:strand:+ start:399 stop:620 length:222 start_codon:yes stop_codon:yes gene_type:complete